MEPAKDNRGEHRKPQAAFPPTPAELDALIPAYTFTEYLDSGGMGSVYKAVQKSLNRTVAVKLLSRIHEGDGFAERFKRESQALAQLSHPNIVAVHDCGETCDGQMYYVMEFVSGMDLQQLLRRRSPSPRQILQIITQVCNALQYAHERGIVHRDIKPANILIDDQGNVKVADFGLVKIVDAQAVNHTATGATLGTPDYIAPEALLHGVKIDHRADIYSLGVMIYELLTGHLPKGKWEPPSIRSGADKKVDAVVSKAMQNDPDKRYQQVSEMTQVLEKLLKTCDSWKNYQRPSPSGICEPGENGGQASTGAVTQKLDRGRFRSRRGWLARMAAGVVLLVIGGGVAVWQFGGPASAPQPSQGAPEAGLAPASPAAPAGKGQKPAPAIDAEAQTRLGHWVIGHGGFVNLLTPDNIHNLILPGGKPATWPPGKVATGSSMKLIGGGRDARVVDDLPVSGPFVIWRVSLLEAPITSAADLGELARLVREAGTVSNLNLHGLDVPRESLGLLASMTTLVSLDLTGSPVINASAVPYLAECAQLKLLLLGGAQVDEALLEDLRGRLPFCGVHQITPW
ncbi:MAG: serine/threonine-protein kinase [Prosthecobacter sp.]